jgi:DNA repair photolyase
MTKQFTGTREWACKNFNVCRGCSHDCGYCYAKGMAIRFGRVTAETWKNQIPLPAKLPEAVRGKPTRFMFPSTHDITPECLDICLDALKRLLSKGHEVLVVTKPHYECIQAICDWLPYYRDKLMFRFTIGSVSNAVLKAWEPNAPTYEERLASLRLAYDFEFQTSVSCEPMLDTRVEDIIKAVDEYVSDTIWIGLMNDVKQRLTLNGASPEIHAMGEDLTKQCSKEMISGLYGRLKDNPKIRWKDSIKKMLGLERPTAAGLDI